MVAPFSREDDDRIFHYNLAADGSTDWIRGTRRDKSIVFIYGDFGSGDAAVEYSPDKGSTVIADAELSFSTNGVAIFNSHGHLWFRVTLATSTNPDLNVTYLV